MKPEKKLDHWKLVVGKRPHTLTAEERPDRDFEVFLRWQEKHPESGESVPRYSATGLTVRDDRGRRRREKEQKAAAVAERAQELLASGRNPRDWNKAERKTGEIPRTLSEGFREALPDSKNPAHVGTLYALRDKVSLDARAGADYVELHLGPDTLWVDLKPAHVVRLWRAMARAYKAGERPGFRAVKRALSALHSTWSHLRETYDEFFPVPHWPVRSGRRLREDWEKITGESLKEVRRERRKRLRYSEVELKELFCHLPLSRQVEVVRGRTRKRTLIETRPYCDPRVRTLVEIGAELRPGQVLRASRSHLDLTLGLGGFGLGRFLGEKLGKGQKAGETVDLHPELRAHLEEVLDTGYLSELETARRRGVITDFPLFPSGKLVDGRIPLDRVLKYPTRTLHVTNAIKHWIAFETAVGVKHVNGRSFYGLRRGLTDTANDRSTDDRVLDRLTGHQDPETRREYYLDRDRDEDRAKAAELRRQMRLALARADGSEDAKEPQDETADLSVEEIIQRLDKVVRARVLAALSEVPRD
jgi:integrase